MTIKKTLFAAIHLFVSSVFAVGQPTYAQCRDPWINNAYQEITGRPPVGSGEICECNIKLYNNGSWNNYNELKNYVRELRSNGIKLAYKNLGGGRFAMAVQGNGTMGVVIMDQAGRIVAAGGGNLIGNDSAGLIGNDGSTLTVPRSTPGFTFSGSFSTLSGPKIRTSGRGGIKIQ